MYGQYVVGVVLTGTGRDGAAGLARIKQRGGRTIVQDPATATRAAMPEAALASTTADFNLPGTYVLRLTASDSQLNSSADVTVTVLPGSPHTQCHGA